MQAAIQTDSVRMSFGRADLVQEVLKGINLSIERGESCLLLGPSGSGKTTLLALLGCLLSPSSGGIKINGHEVIHRSKPMLASLRRRWIGFVFQHAQLLPFANVEQNLSIVGRNAGMSRKVISDRVEWLLEQFDLRSLRGRMPHCLSGGQRQRVAIARAVLHSPVVILADEPTAALDFGLGQRAVALLIGQARSQNAALIAVTHDTRLVPMFDRIMHLDGGELREV